MYAVGRCYQLLDSGKTIGRNFGKREFFTCGLHFLLVLRTFGHKIGRKILELIDMRDNIGLFLEQPYRRQQSRIESMMKITIIATKLFNFILVLLIDAFRIGMVGITSYFYWEGRVRTNERGTRLVLFLMWYYKCVLAQKTYRGTWQTKPNQIDVSFLQMPIVGLIPRFLSRLYSSHARLVVHPPLLPP